MTVPTIHDANQAIEFLRWLRPAGPWLLVAIAVDQAGIEGETLTDDDAIRRWLAKHATRNVYYSINPTRETLHKKSEAIDIARVEYLQIDIDPRRPDEDANAAESIARDRARILALLQAPPAPVPPPSIIIDSGGGYQALWKLDEPIELEAESKTDRQAAAEDAKLYSLKLKYTFDGADGCHNIDRIFRLPGSINYPYAHKREKGRVRSQSIVHSISGDVYSLERFQKASAVAAPVGKGSGGKLAARPRMASTGNVRRYMLDELAAKYPATNARAWAIALQGTDPNDPDKFGAGERSEWLFYLCCELTRGAVPEDVIYSVITDPDNKISASVLDKGPTRERYAWRQIERAREFAVDPILAELNERHAVIENLGGDCRVAEMLEDPVLGRSEFSHQSFSAFRNRYLNRTIQVGADKAGKPITQAVGAWWLASSHRRQYRSVTFSPNKDVLNMYNLWQGFAVEPRPGDNHQSFLDHIRDNICSGNTEVFAYVVGWMARAVQHPDEQGEVAIVLKGDRGTGKSVFATMFGALFGPHFLHIANSSHLVGNFNGQLRDAVVIFGDESFFAGDKRHESVLKQIITERSVVIENKGIDAKQATNFAHLILASNENWVVPVGHEERRFLMIDVPKRVLERGAMFAFVKSIKADLQQRSGLSNLLYYLQNYNLENFEPRDYPHTEALHDQAVMSLPTEAEWLLRKLEDGILLPSHVEWSLPIVKDRLIEDYIEYASKIGARRAASATALERFLLRVIPGITADRRHTGPHDFRGGGNAEHRAFWMFPPLDVCRAGFATHVLTNHAWRDLVYNKEPPEAEAVRSF